MPWMFDTIWLDSELSTFECQQNFPAVGHSNSPRKLERRCRNSIRDRPATVSMGSKAHKQQEEMEPSPNGAV